MKGWIRKLIQKIFYKDQVWISSEQYKHLNECKQTYDKLYSFEKGLAYNKEDKVYIAKYDATTTKLVLNAMKSTKNALLLSQKRAKDAVEIAYRDGGLFLVDLLIQKFESLGSDTGEKELR